jgi:hypothetical protein
MGTLVFWLPIVPPFWTERQEGGKEEARSQKLEAKSQKLKDFYLLACDFRLLTSVVFTSLPQLPEQET